MTEAIIKTLPGKNVGSFSKARLNSRLPFPELAQVPRNGLVFWVDAGNARSYSGTGTTWADLSGNGYDLTLQNSANITYNSLGYFSTGTNGYFDRGSGNALIPDGNDSYSMLVWVRMPSWSGSTTYGMISIGTWNVNNGSNAFAVAGTGNAGMSTAGGLYHYWWNNDLIIYATTTFCRPGCWFMANCSYDGTTRKVYTNTILAASDTPVNHNVTSNTFRIGYTDPAAGQFLRGDVAVGMIYDRALNDSEIVQIYNTYRNRFGV